MKCALVKCRREFDNGFRDNSESLALGYLAAALRSEGHAVSISNAEVRAMNLQDHVGAVLAFNGGLVGINVADPGLVSPTIEFARQLRSAGSTAHICVGGHTATFHFSELLNACPEIDSIALHEGEETICELAKYLTREENWRAVPGIGYLDSRSDVIRTNMRAPKANLDAVQFPARDDLPYVLETMPEVGVVPVLSSRGCHFRCGFCSVRAFSEFRGQPLWRRRSLDNVLDEIESLLLEFQVHDILFVDDLFISRSKESRLFATEFASAVKRRAMRFSFTLSATVDSVEEETFRELKGVGLRQVYLGAEAASTEMLRYLGKWFRPQHITAAIETLRSLEILASVSFINFTPASDVNSLRINADFFKGTGVNYIHGLLNRFQLYGGTPIYTELLEANMITGVFPHFDYKDSYDDVAAVYRICQQVFGAYLDVAYQAKELSRKHNSASFHRIISGINEDAAGLFRGVLDYVESMRPFENEAETKRFIDSTRIEADQRCGDWRNALKFVESTFAVAERPPLMDIAQQSIGIRNTKEVTQ
jgi:hypothetical protein